MSTIQPISYLLKYKTGNPKGLIILRYPIVLKITTYWENCMNDTLATVRTNAKKQLKIKIEEYETRKPYKIYKYSLLQH